jgi:putative oxidoreductase
LIPATAGIGALLLIATMIGAIVTHLFIIGGSPAIAIGLLIAMVIVAWGRWKKNSPADPPNQTPRVGALG